MRIFLVLNFLTLSWNGFAVDPIVTVMAKDSVVTCGETQTETAIGEWYNAAAFAEANDPNGGPITFEANLTLEETIAAFNSSAGSLCGNNRSVTVSFSAVDQNGDTTPAGEATFATEDIQRPTIVEIPSFVSYTCDADIETTFQQWITSRGGAEATDNCGNVQWTRFVWNDSEGNSGIGQITTGPYPPLLETCEFQYLISFIVEDQCGNERATTGRFSVTDDEPPSFVSVPVDITVNCNNVPNPEEIMVVDNCTADPQVDVDIVSTQGNSDLECSFYNYTLNVTYAVTDGCGLSISQEQEITVVDDEAPVINAQDTVVLTCDNYQDIEANQSFSAIDNCSTANITFTDQGHTASCSFSFERSFEVTDVCGNSVSFSQWVQVRDSIAPTFDQSPRDTIVPCENQVGINNIFRAWRDDILEISTADNCNSSDVFAAIPGSYDIDDPTTFPGLEPDSFDPDECSETIGIAAAQAVDFVVFDDCGNARLYQRFFQTSDNTAPNITECPPNISVTSDECSATISIGAAMLEDNCPNNNPLATVLIGNQQYPVLPNQSNTISDLAVGAYSATYTVTDCGGNSAQCTFEIEVLENTAPTLTCPTDMSLDAGTGCAVDFTDFFDFETADNCGFTKTYFQQQPTDGGFDVLTFNADENLNNFTTTFTEVFQIENAENDAFLTISLVANLPESQDYIDVFDENGILIGSITGPLNCEGANFQFPISKTQINSYVTDGVIDFSFIASTTNPIQPCGELSAGTDGITTVRAQLSYSDAVLDYEVDGATIISTNSLAANETISLNAGTNTVTYTVEDGSGNSAECSFAVVVTETANPTAVCRDIVVNVLPSGVDDFVLEASELDGGSEDNCAIATFDAAPASFDCSMVGQEITTVLTVTDESGNTSSCESIVKVESFNLMPTFSASICENDSLIIFSNVPNNTGTVPYTYEWTGPNLSGINTENLIFPNASPALNGIYSVTVTGLGGCSATGSINITIDPLTNPEISVEDPIVCLGDELILSSTVFTGNITYNWYEGVFPDGVLVATTTVPNAVLEPTEGNHIYYVIAENDDCVSNASNLLEIEVVSLPNPTVNNVFVNICEGETIILGTSTFGNGLTYSWTGPNGFISDRPNPNAIEDASFENAGEYQLVLTRGQCSSDTATTKVNVFEKPAQPIITADELFCEGSTVTLTVNNITNADTYLWYLNGTLYTSENDNTLVIPNANTTISGDWTVVVESDICSSDFSVAVPILVDNLQEVTASNTGPACQGDSIQLLATFITNAIYEWSGPSGFTSNEQNPTIAAVGGEYTVRITTNTNCEISESTLVETSLAPTITALSNSSQNCMLTSESIVFFPTLVPAGTYDFVWSGPNGFASEEQNPTLENLVPEMNGTYALTVLNEGCASDTVFTEVAFTIEPDQPTISISGIPCDGNEIRLVANTNVDNLTYRWNTPNGLVNTNEAELIIENLSENDNGNYSVVAINGICESEASPAFEVTINDQNFTPVFESNSPVCNGNDLVLEAQIIEGATYLWTGPNGFSSDSSVVIVPNANLQNAGTYTLSIEIDGCPAFESTSEEIEVLENLLAPEATELTYNLCSNQTEAIEICINQNSAQPGADFSLVNAATGGILATSNSTCFLVEDFSSLTTGANFFNILAIIDDCSSESAEPILITLENEPTLQANIVQSDLVLCDAETINISTGPTLVNVFVQWSSSTGVVFGNDEAENTTASSFSIGENLISVSYSTVACPDFSSDELSVFLAASPIAEDDDYILTSTTGIVLNVRDNDTFEGQVSEISITTPPNSGDVSFEGGQLVYTPDPTFSGIITFQYEICDETCTDLCDTGIVTIEQEDVVDCIAPTIITPNEDGINDAFIVPCLNGGDYPDSELIIFNQWGDELFSEKDYKNNWTGTYLGDPLPAGTYFYQLDLGDGSEPIHSFLVIQK